MLWPEAIPIRDPRVLLAISLPLFVVALGACVATVIAVVQGVGDLAWWHAVLTLLMVAPMGALLWIALARIAWMRRYRRVTGESPPLR